MIMIIAADQIFAECIARACADHKSQIFDNVYDAIDQIDTLAPDLIFLDLLPIGPDGFTFLNEIASYPETAKIPIIALSEQDLSRHDLSVYNIVATLQKDTMTPEMIKKFVQFYPLKSGNIKKT